MQKNVLEYLENSVLKTPDKIAFVDSVREYTYREIKQTAQRVAGLICKQTQKYNEPIAVFVDRTVESLIGFMAVLYSGNYYVPIDNKMPKQRIEKMLLKVKPEVVLCAAEDYDLVSQTWSKKENLQKIIPILSGKMVSQEFQEISEIEDELKKRREKILDVDPAYIIFTSGSTGEPKGIVISHKSVIDFTDWMVDTFHFDSHDVLGNQAPFYFDLSVKDIYTTLKCGATAYILPKKLFMFPVLLADFLNEKKVTACIWATSAFRLMAKSGVFEKKTLETVQKVILGGEALMARDLNIWRKAMPKIEYVNLYGPTEVTVDCTYYKIERDFSDKEAIPIGVACKNKEVLLLNEEGKEANVNEPGEICVRGTGLAKGYFGDFEKTNEVFIQNPLQSHYPDLLYKTGDIGVCKEDGLIYFQCRKDGQIKHQGYRIELGEIERALSGFEKCHLGICFFVEEKDRIVCAFEGETDEKEIQIYLQDILPKYMIPNMFIKYPKIPYNSNGKIDRVQIKAEYYSNKRYW